MDRLHPRVGLVVGGAERVSEPAIVFAGVARFPDVEDEIQAIDLRLPQPAFEKLPPHEVEEEFAINSHGLALKLP